MGVLPGQQRWMVLRWSGSCVTTSSWTWGCQPCTAPGVRPTPCSARWPKTSQVRWRWGQWHPSVALVRHNPHRVLLAGVRVLRQDPVECLLSFICTSNNHISRITAMIERLCQAFGRRLCRLDAKPFHAFPSLSALTGLPSPCHGQPTLASSVPTHAPLLSPRRCRH